MQYLNGPVIAFKGTFLLFFISYICISDLFFWKSHDLLLKTTAFTYYFTVFVATCWMF